VEVDAMTDLLGPPNATPDAPDPDADGAPGRRPVDWLLAALLAGAGAIHLAMAPSHLGLDTVEGVGFLVAGWLQLALAALMLVRPSRPVLYAAIGTSAVLLVVWAISRTSGLPIGGHEGEAESVSLVDGAAAVLEVAALLLGATLLTRPSVRVSRSAWPALAGVVGALVLTTAAIASPDARDHASGDHHGDDASADEAHGHEGEQAADAAHHDVEAEADDLGFAALQNGQMGAHEHTEGMDEEPALAEEIDPVTAGTLAQQLALTAPLVEAYPTIAAAKAAGYWQAGPFSPGLGVHFNSPRYNISNNDGIMDPADIGDPILIYDGIEDDSRLAGFMYMAYQETEPEGFAGPLDRWHYHTAVCIVNTPDGIRTPFGADLSDVTDEMCEAEGGAFLEFTGYMVHVWTVPGYESDLGTFSDPNPRITCPDGSYHTVPTEEIGGRATTCKKP
jgi:hypothetical protein